MPFERFRQAFNRRRPNEQPDAGDEDVIPHEPPPDEQPSSSGGPLALLEILEGPDAKVNGVSVGRIIRLYDARAVIGRNPRQVTVQLYNLEDNSSVSRIHCTIEYFEAIRTFMITDEGSTSGTWVGGTRLKPYEPTALHNKDEITLGSVGENGARLRFTTSMALLDTGNLGARLKIESDLNVRQTVLPFVPPTGIIMAAEPKMPSSSARWDIFLSYSRSDEMLMIRLRDALRGQGWQVWTDENLTLGTPTWEAAISGVIKKARCMVVVLSPDAEQLTWVNREVAYGETMNLTIFPILVRGDERSAIPVRLIQHQWIDGRHDLDAATHRLIAAISDFLSDSTL